MKGYSLLETTIMIAIGSILAVSFGVASQAQIKSAIDNRNTLIALHLAKQQMAIINNGTYPSVGVTTPSVDGGSGLFPGFSFTQTVTNCGAGCTSGSNTLNQIQLDVSANGNVLVRLYTYRSNIVTFGNGS